MGEQESKQELSAPGRPRSDASHQAILQAMMEILQQEGYRATSIEVIAARAGVGKKTIYRWWPSKAAVALEALTAYTEAHVPFSDTGSLERDLTTYFWCDERLQKQGKHHWLLSLSIMLPGMSGKWCAPGSESTTCRSSSREGVRILPFFLPTKSPWLNPIEPQWVHGKRNVVERDGLLTAHQLAERVCA